MKEQEIFSQVQEIFQDVFDDDSLELTRETNAENIEDWDSLAQIRLIVAMEKQFKIKIPANELQRLADVGEMIDLISDKIQSRQN